MCETCSLQRYCEQKNEISRRVFFSMATGEEILCLDYRPRWWHGVEGVAA